MTKSELETLIKNSYVSVLEQYKNQSYVKDMLAKYADDNNKISTENLFVACFMESTKLNLKIISDVLSNVLELE